MYNKYPIPNSKLLFVEMEYGKLPLFGFKDGTEIRLPIYHDLRRYTLVYIEMLIKHIKNRFDREQNENNSNSVD